MTLTANELSRVLQAELDKGYDVVRIARVAFQLYQDYGVELAPDIDVHPRVADQPTDSRMGRLKGKLTNDDLQNLTNNPNATTV